MVIDDNDLCCHGRLIAERVVYDMMFMYRALSTQDNDED